MKNNNIIIVGGGTAGCIAALILKTRFPQKNISIIESTNVGIVGVGESSTEHWTHFCNFVGINHLDAILHCNGTFKVGVYFENWAENDFLHNLSPPHVNLHGAYFRGYGHQISLNRPKKDLHSSKVWMNEFSLSYFNNLNDSPTSQYHFDTFALNEYLHKKCTEREISIIVDDIVSVKLDSVTENIKSVVSEKWEYPADFFLDCTGFTRLLLNKTYNVKWKSYAEYLPLNSAIVFPTEEMEEYNKYTKSTARNAGWSWTIPTQTRTGNGYVYCDGFIGKDEAHQEMEEAYGQSLEIVKEFKFDPGRLEKAWHKNCYAVGLSQSFVEPLEATSIGSIIQQMFCFIHFLPSYDVDSCNQHINDIFDNIVDYIQAHYLVKKENTPFWKEVKYNLKLTSKLNNYLDKWKNRLPLNTDIECAWKLFGAANYIPILYGLDWFNVGKIKEEYDEMMLYNAVENEIKYEEHVCDNSIWMSHKTIIKEMTRKNIIPKLDNSK